MSRSILIVFYALVFNFLLIVAQISVPQVTDVVHGPVFLIPFVIFFILGTALVYLTLKQKISGRLRWFLFFSGLSGIGFLVSVILHNFFYALAEVSSSIVFLKYFFEILHVAFFLMSIPIIPVLFLVGMVGTIAVRIKNR